MLAILIQPDTLELITAMNNGIEPEIEYDDEGQPTTFFVYVDKDTEPAVITEETFDVLRDEEPGWEPVKYAHWRK